jgi:hypothetical protein
MCSVKGSCFNKPAGGMATATFFQLYDVLSLSHLLNFVAWSACSILLSMMNLYITL